MSIGFDALFGVHQHTMVIRNQRAEVLAGILANADTPGYKARDLDFNVAFKQAAHIVDEDPKALVKTNEMHMDGSEIDFVDDLMGQSFQIRNPNATASCGCGTSFAI